jgi:hypothetical protein
MNMVNDAKVNDKMCGSYALKSQLAEVEKHQANIGVSYNDPVKREELHKLYRIEDQLKKDIRRAENFEVKVGDGVTMCLYSDSHAYTVIKRTAKSITCQRDIATRNPDFKPEFVIGGFVGHCTNQDKQTYTYERDTTGSIDTFRWSEKHGCFQGGSDGSIKIINGRYEFYDYNF